MPFLIDVDDIHPAIADNDTMQSTAQSTEAYLQFGRPSVETIAGAFDVVAQAEPESLLDFGCGSGRILRWLRAWRPDAVLMAADILEDAVDFCHREFGAVPFYVDKPFDEISFGQRFDCIWAGSVFTHMGQDGWHDLTDLLVRHLGPGGILSFSYAGPRAYELICERGLRLVRQDVGTPMTSDYEATGFGHFTTRPRDGTQDWGRTIVHPDWVRHFVGQKGLEIVLERDSVYGFRQDIVCVRVPLPPTR